MPPFARRVLDVVDAIPPGKVMAYGDIAELLGEGGPRQVGRVMSLWGGEVPWHRVVRADGTPAACHDGKALRLLRKDKTPMRGSRVDMRQARWDGQRQGAKKPQAEARRATSSSKP
ncbi:MAG: MGMT family protein [Trebonia sp.]